MSLKGHGGRFLKLRYAYKFRGVQLWNTACTPLLRRVRQEVLARRFEWFFVRFASQKEIHETEERIASF